MHAEQQRLDADARRAANWKRWGPYLAERQWGTVREDYSEYGNCWDYLPASQGLVLFHEHFHGDTGRGLGASHQTGWTALVVRCIENLAAGRRLPPGHAHEHEHRRAPEHAALAAGIP